MPRRRVRDNNIRLLWQEADGFEGLKDFGSVTEAREEARSEWIDWVIFEIEHPFYAAVGRVLDSISGIEDQEAA